MQAGLLSGSNLHGVNSPAVCKGFIFSLQTHSKYITSSGPKIIPCGDCAIIPKLQPHRSSQVPAWFASFSSEVQSISISDLSNHISLLLKNVLPNIRAVFKQLLENHNPSEKAKS